MNINPIRNLSFCRNTWRPISSPIRHAKTIISKQEGIDLFLDKYGELLEKIKLVKENISKLEIKISQTSEPNNKLKKDLENEKKKLHIFQNNKNEMEKIIHVIDTFANSNQPIEIEFIDSSNENDKK